MKLAELKKLMPDASKEVIAATLEAINTDAQTQIDAEVDGLKKNQTKNLDQIKALKGNQAPEGYDPDAYKEYVKNKDDLAIKQKELDDAALEGKGQWDALKIQLNDTNATKLAEQATGYDTKISGLEGALRKELVENAAIKAIEAEQGNSLFLLPHMTDSIKMVANEAGEYGIQVIDKEGNARLKDDATTAFGVNDLVAELKANDKYRAAFPEMNAGGGGNPNPGGDKGGKGINPWKAETKNITAQAKINKENPVLAEQFKKAAGLG